MATREPTFREIRNVGLGTGILLGIIVTFVNGVGATPGEKFGCACGIAVATCAFHFMLMATLYLELPNNGRKPSWVMVSAAVGFSLCWNQPWVVAIVAIFALSMLIAFAWDYSIQQRLDSQATPADSPAVRQ